MYLLTYYFTDCRSGDEQFDAAAGQHQLADVKAAETDAHLSSGASTIPPAANQDLAKQLQIAVRSEMRRIMEVNYSQATFTTSMIYLYCLQ